MPTLTSLHVPPYDALRWFVQDSLAPNHRITATSQAHARAWWPDGAPSAVSVLHNGVDPDAWPFREGATVPPCGAGASPRSRGRISPSWRPVGRASR
ncbi:hypothetical protein ACFQWF_06465 [Methylorubrum suomiense]